MSVVPRRMHDDEVDVDDALVRPLLASQMPGTRLLRRCLRSAPGER